MVLLANGLKVLRRRCSAFSFFSSACPRLLSISRPCGNFNASLTFSWRILPCFCASRGYSWLLKGISWRLTVALCLFRGSSFLAYAQLVANPFCLYTSSWRLTLRLCIFSWQIHSPLLTMFRVIFFIFIAGFFQLLFLSATFLLVVAQRAPSYEFPCRCCEGP